MTTFHEPSIESSASKLIAAENRISICSRGFPMEEQRKKHNKMSLFPAVSKKVLSRNKATG